MRFAVNIRLQAITSRVVTPVIKRFDIPFGTLAAHSVGIRCRPLNLLSQGDRRFHEEQQGQAPPCIDPTVSAVLVCETGVTPRFANCVTNVGCRRLGRDIIRLGNKSDGHYTG